VRTTVKDDFYGELPVIERWHDCHHTRTGWSGIRENGEPVHMVLSDTMHETVTERLALQLVRQPARERHRVDQAAQRRGVSCRQLLSSLLAPTKR